MAGVNLFMNNACGSFLLVGTSTKRNKSVTVVSATVRFKNEL